MVARIQLQPLLNKLKKQFYFNQQEQCLYSSQTAEVRTLSKRKPRDCSERLFLPLLSVILLIKSRHNACSYRWGREGRLTNKLIMSPSCSGTLCASQTMPCAIFLCHSSAIHVNPTSPISKKSCGFVPVVKSCSCKDHGVLIGPLGSVAPAWSGTIPVVAPCWITNNTVRKTLPYSEGKVHLVK